MSIIRVSVPMNFLKRLSGFSICCKTRRPLTEKPTRGKNASHSVPNSREHFSIVAHGSASTFRPPLISIKELLGVGIVIFLSLGNHTHSFSQEDQYTLSRYRSICKTTDNFEQSLKTNRALSCQRCEDLVVIDC